MANHEQCLRVQVPNEACYVRFSGSAVARSSELGESSRGEMLIADYDANGRIIGIELVGADKPCQGTRKQKSKGRR